MLENPSPWMMKYAPQIKSKGRVLDLACGKGRHAIWLAQQGFLVDAIDRDQNTTSHMKDIENINVLILDLETSEPPKFTHTYDGIIVSRYLHRPLLTLLADILNPSGILIYETFMSGNERYGKPSNPDFLLLPDELLTTYAPLLSIIGFEQGEEQEPRPAVIQRICAQKHA
jgi:SAM-dependent methyltransferase